METIRICIELAGLAQLVLVAASLAIPRVLSWSVQLALVQPLIKQMFWTYAGYIAGINICFGLVSVFAVADVIAQTRLAAMVTGFIAAYWLTRIIIQFFYFDRAGFPNGRCHKVAEVMLILLFVALTLVYAIAFLYNLKFFI